MIDDLGPQNVMAPDARNQGLGFGIQGFILLIGRVVVWLRGVTTILTTSPAASSGVCVESVLQPIFPCGRHAFRKP